MPNPYDFDPSYAYTLQQLLQIKPPKEPRNFDSFWKARYQNALNLQPTPQIKDTGKNQAGWRIFDINYQSSGQFNIRGWLLLPESGIIKRGFIIGHGYGGRDAPDFHLPFKDAAMLFPCFRGLSLSAKEPISSNPQWHVLHNIDTLHDYIIGACVEDVWLAVSALLRLFPQLSGHLGYLGISFSGGIGAMALAYEQRIARGHLNVPAFGHNPLRLRLPTLGSACSQQQYYQQHKKQTLQVLRFYDAATAAKRIMMPMHYACAVYDPCVAPPGQFAIYNATQADKQLFVLKAGHHDYPHRIQQETKLLAQLTKFFKPLST
ncbi:MAG: acetylxylan esterase [Methylococcaceae bacterium]|nr:acetylxylan esterase [Methylococcaceae bacterium]